jgi:hypothetical protein
MARICVPLVEFLLQIVMGWVLILEYMLSGARGLLWSCLILSGNECFRPSRPQCWSCLSHDGSPQVGRLDARVPPGSG